MSRMSCLLLKVINLIKIRSLENYCNIENIIVILISTDNRWGYFCHYI